MDMNYIFYKKVRINCQNFDMLSAAFEQFLGKSASEQVNYVAEVLVSISGLSPHLLPSGSLNCYQLQV